MSVFKASPTMAEFMTSEKYVRVLAGPIGGGKSVTCVHELLRWASEQAPNKDGERKTRFLICRNTADQLRSTTQKTFFDWVPPGEAGEWRATERTFYLRAGLPDGTTVKSEFMFIALDTPEDIRKALSLEATGLWGNESRELHPEVVDGLLMRVNRYPSMKDGGATRAGAIFDTNMPGDDTWWSDKMQNPPKNWSVHIQPAAVIPSTEYVAKYHTDPPADLTAENYDGVSFTIDHACDNFANLARNYYPETLEGKTQDFIDVYLRCMYGRSLSGQPVHRSFVRDFHVAKAPLMPILNGLRPVIIGADFGLNPSTTIGQLDMRGRLLIYSALTSDGMGLVRFIDTILRPHLATKFPGAPVLVVGDPAGRARVQTDESTVYDILKQKGFKAMPASTNSIVARVAAVDGYLNRQVDGGAGILIDPVDCGPLIKALAGRYRYKKRKDGEMDDTPEKNEASHIADSCFVAGTRISTPFGDVNIEDVRAGFVVNTLNGPRKVLAASCTGIKPVVKYAISTGEVLVATPNHPVFSFGKKFVAIDDLQYADILLTRKQLGVLSWLQSILFRNSTERSITVSQLATTKPSTTQPSEPGTCTVMYGFFTTALSRTVSMCTTLTATVRTIGSRILSVSASTSTQSSTWLLAEPLAGTPTSPSHAKRPLNGIGLQQDVLGTANTPSRSPKLPKTKPASARTAEKRLSGQRGSASAGSAPCPARGVLVRLVEWTISTLLVPSAVKLSVVTSTLRQKPVPRIVGKRPLAKPKAVFNLSVEGQEMYFANDVLVHNCQYLCLHAEAAQGGKLEGPKRREIVRRSSLGWT